MKSETEENIYLTIYSFIVFKYYYEHKDTEPPCTFLIIMLEKQKYRFYLFEALIGSSFVIPKNK